MKHTLLSLVGLMLGTASAMAQVPGDWNADGQVTPADYLGLETCLIGPAVTTSGACASTFDPESTGFVSLRNAIEFSWVGNGAPCLLWPTNRSHVLVTQTFASVFGSLARITTSDVPTLCSGGPQDREKLSLRWTAVQGYNTQNTDLWFIQVGYGRAFHLSGLPTLNQEYTVVYAEIKSIGNPITDFVFREEPTWSPVFSAIQLRPTAYFQIKWRPGTPTSTRSTAHFLINDSSVLNLDREIPASEVPTSPATEALWAAETARMADRMAGSPLQYCLFSDMTWEVGAPDALTETYLLPSDVQRIPAGSGWFHGRAWLSPSSFAVWDFRNFP
jgi:hypothetical protein